MRPPYLNLFGHTYGPGSISHLGKKSRVCSNFIPVGFAREDLQIPPPGVLLCGAGRPKASFSFLSADYRNSLGSQHLCVCVSH